MKALIGTTLRGRVVNSEGTYIIVFQAENSLGNSLGSIFHRLVTADLLASTNLEGRRAAAAHFFYEPQSWDKYAALRAHGGLHITLGTELPARDVYTFRIGGHRFVPALNTTDAAAMPGYYALILWPVDGDPLGVVGDDSDVGVRDYHASVVQLMAKRI